MLSTTVRLFVACWLATLAMTSPVRAQGSISGSVTDSNGLVCPGATITATTDGVVRGRAVSDASGLYALTSLPAGSYTLSVTLTAFAVERRDAVAVFNDAATNGIDFALCPIGRTHFDWPVPHTIDEMWKQADLVAHVRIVATSKIRADCVSSGWRHQAAVIEVFKGANTGRITFSQEQWASERAPYGKSQEFVLFLRGSPARWSRLAGPYCVFQIDGTAVRSGHPGLNTEGLTAEDFLNRLRQWRSDPSKPRDKKEDSDTEPNTPLHPTPAETGASGRG